jgi:hypothetical protein
LPGILAIFNEVIATSTAIYYFEPARLEDCTAWFNARQADLDGRRALAAGAAAHGVASIDVADDLHADDLFGDPGHVNQAGAERYTTLLAEGMNRLAP